MQSIHKINVNKSDEAALVAEKIIDIEASEIILNIPRFAKISEAAANFKLLKREAEALSKKILIESVDDKVIALCKELVPEAMYPFYEEPSSSCRISYILVTKNKKPARSASR